MYDFLKSRGLIPYLALRLGVVILLGLGGFLLARYLIVRTSGCMPSCINVNMIDRSLSGADLRRVNFTDAILRRADLSRTDLRDADLSGANLNEANLQKADLRDARLVGADLTKADLRGAIFSGTDLRGALLVEANLTRADLTQVRLLGVDLSKAELVEANLTNTQLSGIAFVDADLSGADLSGANLVGAYLSRADLSGARLVESDLTGAWLNLSNLTGADLTNASLFGVSLLGANLASARLQGSGLGGALIVGVNLRGGDLRGANLQSIRLFQTELAPRDTQLDPVIGDLNELQRSMILVDADLRGVEYNSRTKWPTGKLVLLSNMLGRNFAETVAAEAAVEETPPPEEAAGEVEAPQAGAGGAPKEEAPLPAVFSSYTPQLLTQTLYNLFQREGYTDTLTLRSGRTATAVELFCEKPEVDAILIGRALREEEFRACAGLDRQPLEMQFAIDAQVIVANPANSFLVDIAYQSIPTLLTAETWWDVNDEWPTEPILRYLPEVESGAFDIIARDFYSDTLDPLTEAPNTIFTEDNNELIQAIALDPNALGLMSNSSYMQNAEILNVVTVDGALPEPLLVSNGVYSLTHPLYIYVDIERVKTKPELGLFFNFFLNRLTDVRDRVGFFPVRLETLEAGKSKLQQIRGSDTVTATVDFGADFPTGEAKPAAGSTPEAEGPPKSPTPETPIPETPTPEATTAVAAGTPPAPSPTITATQTMTATAPSSQPPGPTAPPGDTPTPSSPPSTPTPATPAATVAATPTPTPEEGGDANAVTPQQEGGQ